MKNKTTRKFTAEFDIALLDEIDEDRKITGASFVGWLRVAAREKLNRAKLVKMRHPIHRQIRPDQGETE